MYGADSVTAEGVIAGLADERPVSLATEIPLDDLVHLANEAPVVKLVNLLLLEALDARASDVHLEGYADTFRVRYRIDGMLQDAPSPPAHLAPAVVSRLKIMAELDIAERRVPQDGRIRLRLQNRQVDVRVSTLPTLHGESVVLRLLDKERGVVALEKLGMPDDTLQSFVRVIGRPHGIVLATGPTGSGKTTTLYAAVARIRSGREKILTVEDPDIMLIGEIRDKDTAEIATHAALTGHLVLSTLHTNDAVSALTRLLDLGVPAYLIASTVEAVLAQRLVRRVCEDCREQMPAPAGLAKAFDGEAGLPDQVSRGAGCGDCRATGYRGAPGCMSCWSWTTTSRRRSCVRPRQEKSAYWPPQRG